MSVPNWYINAPSNSANIIYGTGEANSLEEAKTSALNSMSSRLVVSVGSSLQQIKKTSNNAYSKQVTQNIKVDVAKIRFANAKVVKNAIIGDRYFVLMSVDRIELFNQKKKSFVVLDENIDNTINKSKNLSKLERIYAVKKLSNDIITNRKKAFVLYAINNSFDYAPYFKKYDSYLNLIDTLKSSLKISVTSNESNRFFADIIVDLLNSKHYKVVKNSDDVDIKLHNKIRYSTYKGWHIAKVSTTISVVSNGKTISNKTINFTGRSSSNQLNALQNGSKYFNKKLNKIGIDTILFGK
jgi:hypothetical protein